MAKIRIRQCAGAVEAGRGTILEAALRAGLPYPHSCRSGACGACKSRLHEGEVTMGPHDPAALTATERRRGLILACRARPRGDVEVEWLGGASAPVLRLRGRVHSLESPNPEVRILRVETESRLPFAAGQYARLRFGRLPARPYSMANRPDEPVLEFHVRIVPNGVVSGHVATRLRPGDAVTVEGPFGDAWLRDDGRPIVAVAGGTGLGPIRSIVRTAVGRDRRPARVYVGFRSEALVYGVRELARLAPVEVVLSRPAGGTSRRTGLVHEALADDLPGLAGAAIHAAGPPAMVAAVRRAAAAAGVPDEQIHADAFTAAPPDPAPGLLAGLWNWLPGLAAAE